MRLRQGSDAILVGVNTILADDPSLTFRKRKAESGKRKQLRRIVLDSRARTPLTARVVSDEYAALTTIVVGKDAPEQRVTALAKRVNVLSPRLKRWGEHPRKPARQEPRRTKST
ncbi:MAG: dihydrofolate reductase family protein, partial [Verrucomicrobiota bacterium]